MSYKKFLSPVAIIFLQALVQESGKVNGLRLSMNALQRIQAQAANEKWRTIRERDQMTENRSAKLMQIDNQIEQLEEALVKESEEILKASDRSEHDEKYKRIVRAFEYAKFVSEQISEKNVLGTDPEAVRAMVLRREFLGLRSGDLKILKSENTKNNLVHNLARFLDAVGEECSPFDIPLEQSTRFEKVADFFVTLEDENPGLDENLLDSFGIGTPFQEEVPYTYGTYIKTYPRYYSSYYGEHDSNAVKFIIATTFRALMKRVHELITEHDAEERTKFLARNPSTHVQDGGLLQKGGNSTTVVPKDEARPTVPNEQPETPERPASELAEESHNSFNNNNEIEEYVNAMRQRVEKTLSKEEALRYLEEVNNMSDTLIKRTGLSLIISNVIN